MRSKKPDLEDVKRQFAAWRRERRGRAIPENLWTAALKLLDHYSWVSGKRARREYLQRQVSGWSAG